MGPDYSIPDHVTTIFKVPLFFLALLVFLFISLLTGQTQMTLLMLLVLGILALTKLWSRLAFSNLAFKAKVDKTKVFPGEEISFEFFAGNPKLLPVWLQINLPVDRACFFSAKGIGENGICENFFLLWFQKIKFFWKLKALKRGCFTLGQPHILAGDLLGFFPRPQVFKETLEIIVFPKILKIKPFFMPKPCFFGIPGSQSPVQDPVYVLGTREYQSFTPAKFIHWKASARYVKLQEKICQPSVQEKILIVMDVELFYIQRATEPFENMLEAIASLAVYFEARGNAVGFMTNGTIKGGKPGFVPVMRAGQSLPLILETLARMEMRPGTRLLDIFHGQKLWGINLIFCSLSMDVSLVPIKQFYARKRIPVKHLVVRAHDLESISFPQDIQHIEAIYP